MENRQHRSVFVTLAAYLCLAGSMAFAMSASAGAVADEHARQDCPAAQVAAETIQDAKGAPAHAAQGENAEAAAATQTAQATENTKRKRRKNQVESALFHFSF